MEADEKLLVDFQALLVRYTEANAHVTNVLNGLRSTQMKGRALLDERAPMSIENWSIEKGRATVAMTRELADGHEAVGLAMKIQSGIVQEINDKIVLIKEKLGHGKVHQ